MKKPFLKIFLVGAFALTNSYAQELPKKAEQPPKYPGLFETIDELIDIDQKRYQVLMRKIQGSPIITKSLESFKDLDIDHIYLQSLLLHSSPQYIELSHKRDCTFYSFLEYEILNRPNNDDRTIPVRYTDEKDRRLVGLVPIKDFFKFIYKKRCQSNLDINTLFKSENIARTLRAIKFEVPIDEASCFSTYQRWRDNDYIAPICAIGEKLKLGEKRMSQLPSLAPGQVQLRRQFTKEIREANVYKSSLNDFRQEYLVHLCSNLNNRKQFCEKFLTTSFWKKVAQNKIKRPELKYRCQVLTGSDKLSDKMLRTCADKLTINDEICHYLGAKEFPSLVPKPNCSQISENLINGRLSAKYQDCPARTGSEGVVNFNRAYSHLEDKSFENSPANCHSYPSQQMIEFLVKLEKPELWDLQICYDDLIERKEICLPYTFGEGDAPYFEANVVHKVLKKRAGARKTDTCTVVGKKEYNPDRLKWKHNCFLVYDENTCTSNSCPKELYFRNRKLDYIRYKGSLNFDYFPNNIKQDKNSAAYLIEKAKKIRRRAIRNVTDLKFYLSDSNAIVHGLGCAEDLYPRNFNRRHFGQCNPVTFIVDGIIEKSFRFFVTIRTGMDDVHAPRKISWSNLYTSVKNYELYQPIGHWTMYGLK